MGFLVRLYHAVFRAIERVLGGWFLGLAARLVFAAVLFVFFWKSALTKVGSGIAGFFTPSVGAYAQILPKQMEAAGFDPSQLSQLEHVIVYAGTYAEFALPILIVVGLFTRAAALGMIVFVAMMTYTDITGHNVDIGMVFDGKQDSIADQRLMWLFPLLYLMLRGAGAISLDRLFGRRYIRHSYDHEYD
jgi:putative oxidoreductase